MAEDTLDFAAVWARWVEPLAEKTIHGFNGLTNEITKVDRKGVVRVSRNGLTSRIPIEPFRWTVDRLLSGLVLERSQINDEFPRRFSSGVFLVLEQVPIFEVSGRPASIRLKRG